MVRTWQGDTQPGIHECAELHSQDFRLLFLMKQFPAAVADRNPRCQPRLEVLGQRLREHVGLVGSQIIDWRMQRPDRFQFRQDVLLLAAVIG
jgi:hypothetical protein